MTRLAFAVLWLAGAGALSAAGAGQEVETRVLARSPVRVGDQITLEIVAENGAPSLAPGADFGPFELAGPARAVDLGEGRAALHVPLRVFRTGPVEVPSFPVTTATGARAATAAVAVDVDALSTPDASPAAAKLVLADVRSLPLAPVLFAAFVATMLVYRFARRLEGRPVPGELALVRSLARRRTRRPVAREAAREQEEPARVALARIERLVASGLAEQDVALFHERLKRVLVDYLRERDGLGTDERTTTEIVRAIAARRGEASAAAASRLLAACDLVEFADVRPARARALETASAGARLVAGAPEVR